MQQNSNTFTVQTADSYPCVVYVQHHLVQTSMTRKCRNAPTPRSIRRNTHVPSGQLQHRHGCHVLRQHRSVGVGAVPLKVPVVQPNHHVCALHTLPQGLQHVPTPFPQRRDGHLHRPGVTQQPSPSPGQGLLQGLVGQARHHGEGVRPEDPVHPNEAITQPIVPPGRLHGAPSRTAPLPAHSRHGLPGPWITPQGQTQLHQLSCTFLKPTTGVCHNINTPSGISSPEIMSHQWHSQHDGIS
jgi:hypothetical protein